ncbi:MAG: hydantoinase/oxoprolinase family protein [Sphingobium sp.]
MRLGIDVGGTFTDLLLHDQKRGQTFRAKTPSTPEDQSIGIVNGIRLICDIARIEPQEIEVILHGTTVATNAVLEGKGARVGLLVTEGFEYTLHLAKSWTPGPLFGWIIMDKPEPLASLDDTRAVHERLDAQGDVIAALDVEKATAVIHDLCGSGIEALTICLMHSYANPAHEQALKAIVETHYPDLPVSLSSDILPEFREYDRAITTVMNDYVRPIMRRYLSRIESRLKAEGIESRLHIVRSDGGVMSAEAASERPVHTVLSGPAGGVTSTVVLSQTTGRDRLLAFDMGGTSTDVAVIMDGKATISRSTEVGYFPAKVPTLEVRSVGAGGGSIADVSPLTGSLRVGPRSAGAQPGPVCYSRGGTEPTVSDANAVLGYLPPQLVGGDMHLDIPAARTAIRTAVATPLGLSIEDAAKGILDIANEVMLGALRVITVQRGLDPRDFGIVAFGGAGPLHANAMAQVLGCYPVLVPTNPGVLSALGFVQSEFKNEFVQTFIRRTDRIESADLGQRFAALRDKAVDWLDGQEIAEGDRRLTFTLDLRYEQQGFEVEVAVEAGTALSGDLTAAIAAFHDQHERTYGVRFAVPVELVALRLTAVGATEPVTVAKTASGGGTVEDALIERRPAYFGEGWIDTPNYDRDRLDPGMRVEGPAIIRQYDTTTVLLPDHWAEIDEHRNILIWPRGKD